MRSTFKLLFYVNKQKIKKNGKCPIMGRITIDGKVCQYSTGKEIAPEHWNPQSGRAIQNCGDIEQNKILQKLNRRLDGLENYIKVTYKDFLNDLGFVSADTIRNHIKNREKIPDTLLKLIEVHNEEFKQRVGVDRKAKSYERYTWVLSAVIKYLHYKGLKDISKERIDEDFIKSIHRFLIDELDYKQNTVSEFFIGLHRVIRLAVKSKFIKRDPLRNYRIERTPAQHKYLTKERLDYIMTIELPTSKMCYTRDLFVFACFTGMGQADLRKFTFEDIKTYDDGSLWIPYSRQKTGTLSHVPLLEIPRLIIEKYRDGRTTGIVFNVSKYASTIQNSLDNICDFADIDYHITFYMGRHTYATEICLCNGLPPETIKKTMGHISYETTKTYVELVQPVVRKGFEKISVITNKKYKLPDDTMPLRSTAPANIKRLG